MILALIYSIISWYLHMTQLPKSPNMLYKNPISRPVPYPKTPLPCNSKKTIDTRQDFLIFYFLVKSSRKSVEDI